MVQKSYIDKLEKVQKRATKMIPELRKMHYPGAYLEGAESAPL